MVEGIMIILLALTIVRTIVNAQIFQCSKIEISDKVKGPLRYAVDEDNSELFEPFFCILVSLFTLFWFGKNVLSSNRKIIVNVIAILTVPLVIYLIII